MSTTTARPATAPPPIPAAARSPVGAALASPATAVAAIWVCSALAAVFAPDMVTGSEQEHLPIALMSIWLWTLSATAYVLLASRGTDGSIFLTGATSVIWGAVLLVSLAAPVMETGTDPTTIPIAAILAPVVGAVATGFVAVHEAARRNG